MLTNGHLQTHIRTLVADKLNLDVPTVETDLVDAGMLDSLTLVELLLHLEQDFDMKISLDELEIDQFRSIARIANFVSQQHQNGASVTG